MSAQTPCLAARRDAAGGPGRSLSARARGGGQRRGRGSEIGAKSAAGPETGSSRVVGASRKRARRRLGESSFGRERVPGTERPKSLIALRHYRSFISGGMILQRSSQSAWGGATPSWSLAPEAPPPRGGVPASAGPARIIALCLNTTARDDDTQKARNSQKCAASTTIDEGTTYYAVPGEGFSFARRTSLVLIRFVPAPPAHASARPRTRRAR